MKSKDPMSFSALSFVRNASDRSSLGLQWRGRNGYRGPFDYAAASLREAATALRVRDFFDVVKYRGCKQNSYDDKLAINSKKSQTLRMTGRISLLCEKSG